MSTQHDIKVTAEEAGIVEMVRFNKATPKLEVRRDWSFGRFKINYRRRSKRNLWGRFGGGWNWNLGFQASGNTVILNLLVATLTIVRERAK